MVLLAGWAAGSLAGFALVTLLERHRPGSIAHPVVQLVVLTLGLPMVAFAIGTVRYWPTWLRERCWVREPGP